MTPHIPFSKPAKAGLEYPLIERCLRSAAFESNGDFNKLSNEIIQKVTGANYSSLVPSCTAALEAIFISLNVKKGDEVIMPSFTFSSTANAVALRGATPVFVDITYPTMNIDPSKIEAAIGEKTKAILVVHYAGIAAQMHTILEIGKRHNLPVIEDAAQCFGAFFDGQHLGSMGLAGTFSFHHTKNITCGEGGAIITSSNNLNDKIQIIAEKGTNRDAFLADIVSKYEWVDLGSSYILSEISAALLSSQLKDWRTISSNRLDRWNHYHDSFKKLDSHKIKLPEIPDNAEHNGHIFFFHVSDAKTRADLLSMLKQNGIQATSHFEPLHLSPAGQKYGKNSGKLRVTEDASATLVRLPLWNEISFLDQDRVISAVHKFLKAC